MAIEIVRASANHAGDIATLTNELGYATSVSDTKEWLHYLINSNNHAAYVAIYQKSSVCGWIVVEQRVSLETGHKAEISGLVTGKNFRRLGVGRELAQAAENWAVKNRLARLVASSNIERDQSHHFYQRIGFSRKKTSHQYEKTV